MTELKESSKVSKEFENAYPKESKLIENMINNNHKKRFNLNEIIKIIKLL